VRCAQAERLLQGLVDGALSAGDRERAEAHVAECDRCRAELAALATVDEGLSGEGRVSPPTGMAEAIVRRAVVRSMMRRRVMVPGWLEAVTFAGVGVGAGALGIVCLALAAAGGGLELPAASAAGVIGLIVTVSLAAFGSVYYRA
jgi:anti-sigma factor RsiW